MSIFPKEGVDFLGNLALNNHRDWFEANKAVYEEAVKRPAESARDAFATMASELLDMEVDVKIFRIHRDVRFSKDKTPYHSYIRIGAWPRGLEQQGGCCLGVSIEPDRQVVGGGIWEFNPSQLEAFRARCGEVEPLIEAAGPLRIPEPELKKVPRGFPDDAPEHVRRKGLTFWQDLDWDGGDIDTASWRPSLKAVVPLHRWLSQLGTERK